MLLISAALLLSMQTSPDAPVVLLAVPAGKCRAIVDGRSMSLRQFRSVVRSWKHAQTDVAFQADPKASYRCVDRVLRIIKDESPIRLGFIGFEDNRAEDRPREGSPQ